MIIAKPIVVGRHNAVIRNGSAVLPGHTGAVTLLQCKENNVLVDTGARGTLDEIDASLAAHDLNRSAIDLIILTHFHLDHAYNVAQFPEARVIGWCHEWAAGETRRIANIEEWNEIAGIRLIRTPGHAEEHVSVLVETADGHVCIAGDAINEHFFRTDSVNVFVYDEALYRSSAKKILDSASFIIPGHGKAFANR